MSEEKRKAANLLTSWRSGDTEWKWFEEGYDRREFRRAQEVLDELASDKHDAYRLGLVIGQMAKTERRLEENCGFAMLAFFAGCILIIAVLFGLTFYGVLHFVAIFVLGLVALYVFYQNVHALRHLSKVYEALRRHPLNRLNIDTPKQAIQFFRQSIENPTFLFRDLKGLQTSKEYPLAGYLLVTTPIWALIIGTFIWFPISLLQATAEGRNGLYNYIGINILGW